MKNRLLSISVLLVIAVGLAACSGDSPTPRDTPDTTTDTWLITAVSVSDPQPYVGEAVTITATVTKNGQPAPDGTKVTFETTGGVFNSGDTQADVASSDGQATVAFLASEAGNYVVRVRVFSASRQLTVQFLPAQSDSLQVFDIVPDRGLLTGGEAVTVTGTQLQSATVTFDVIGVGQFPARATDADPDGSYLVLLTPEITGADQAREYEANVVVEGPEATVTLPRAFRFLPTTGEPVIYGVSPAQGSARGGEQVTIMGANFTPLDVAPMKVEFGTSFGALEAQVLSVSQDGHQIEVITPMLTASMVTQQQLATVTVFNEFNTARQKIVSRANAFIFLPDLEPLRVSSVVPSEGQPEGGQPVTIYGQGFAEPLSVEFSVPSGTLEATVQAVSDNEVQVLTPALNITDTTIENLASIRVTRGVGTNWQETVSLPNAFRYLAASGEPEIYRVVPDSGKIDGGEQVTVYGQNFRDPIEVRFDNSLGTFDANEVFLSGDGSLITLMTPQVAPVGTTEGTYPSNLTVVSEVGTSRQKTVTKPNAYVFLSETPQPEITSISPTFGPIEGGTRVTIFGSGFDFPAQVFFGDREADIIEVNFDQIVARSPSIVPTQPVPPVTVDVRVRNVESGLESTLSAAFTYGEQMFITGNAPTEGPGDEITPVTIFGGGFRDPLEVRWGDAITGVALDVSAVSGAEVLVQMPQQQDLSCSAQTNSFAITHLDSGAQATGGSFTYLGAQPTITGIDPSSVEASADGATVNPGAVTISGRNFDEQVQVKFNSYPVASSDVQVLDEQTIDVLQIPAPNEFGLTFDTVACVTGNGEAGQRQVPTLVSVSVTNVSASCTDSLNMVYEPGDTTCVPVGNLNMNLLGAPFAATPAGSCSPPLQIQVSNPSTTATVNYDINLTGPFTFTGGVQVVSDTVAPGENDFFDVFFCPTLDNNQIQTGLAILSSPSLANDVTINLEGTEASPTITVSPTSINFGTVTPGSCSATAENVTISNGGADSLDWTANLSGRFFLDAGGSLQAVNGSLGPGNDIILDVYFCPDGGDSGTLLGDMEVQHNDPNAPSNPVVVSLEGDAS